jgi:hypothetical protein
MVQMIGYCRLATICSLFLVNPFCAAMLRMVVSRIFRTFVLATSNPRIDQQEKSSPAIQVAKVSFRKKKIYLAGS